MAVKKTEVEGIAKVAGKPVAKTPAKKPAKPVAKESATPAVKKPAKKRVRPYVKKTAPATIPEDAPLFVKLGLTPQIALFCDFYLTHYNGAQAYDDAGFNPKNRNVAAVEAHKILKRPVARQYIAARMKAMFERIEEEQDKLLQTFTYVAYADPNELVENRIDCCRFCYGEGNQYQFTPQEYERHQEQYALDCDEAKILGNEPPEFDPKGGVGFNPNNEPNADCPECFGRGKEAVVFKDTRYLSPAALALYGAVSEGKDGKKMIMHSQEKARETLAKIRKLYDESTNVNVIIPAAAELDAIYDQAMAECEAKSKEVKGRSERLNRSGKN